MSWLAQDKRARQGSWVASMPRPGLVGARGASCPLVGLVGACCSGCAEGKGCSGKEELHAHIGAGEFGTAIPWDDVLASNATIMHVQEAAAALASAPPGTPEAARYMLWYLFFTNWSVWFAAAKADEESAFHLGSGRFISGSMADQYKALILAFNEQLKALDALKVQATAEPIDTRSPAGKAFDATVTGVLSGAGGALGFATTALTYAAIAGAVVLGLYFAGPPLLSLIMRKGKK